jgi:hypothetical protein
LRENAQNPEIVGEHMNFDSFNVYKGIGRKFRYQEFKIPSEMDQKYQEKRSKEEKET